MPDHDDRYLDVFQTNGVTYASVKLLFLPNIVNHR